MNRPPATATDQQWHDWIESTFPFDERHERTLRRRPESERPECGSKAELNDLRGIRDPVMVGIAGPQTRWIAVQLAKLWFTMREREQRYRTAQTRMPTRALEKQRDDFDDGIGATAAPKYQEALGQW